MFQIPSPAGPRAEFGSLCRRKPRRKGQEATRPPPSVCRVQVHSGIKSVFASCESFCQRPPRMSLPTGSVVGLACGGAVALAFSLCTCLVLCKRLAAKHGSEHGSLVAVALTERRRSGHAERVLKKLESEQRSSTSPRALTSIQITSRSTSASHCQARADHGVDSLARRQAMREWEQRARCAITKPKPRTDARSNTDALTVWRARSRARAAAAAANGVITDESAATAAIAAAFESAAQDWRERNAARMLQSFRRAQLDRRELRMQTHAARKLQAHRRGQLARRQLRLPPSGSTSALSGADTASPSKTSPQTEPARSVQQRWLDQEMGAEEVGTRSVSDRRSDGGRSPAAPGRAHSPGLACGRSASPSAGGGSAGPSATPRASRRVVRKHIAVAAGEPIGVRLEADVRGRLTVYRVDAGSSAEAHGLELGSYLIEVDGTSVRRMAEEEIAPRLGGTARELRFSVPVLAD